MSTSKSSIRNQLAKSLIFIGPGTVILTVIYSMSCYFQTFGDFTVSITWSLIVALVVGVLALLCKRLHITSSDFGTCFVIELLILLIIGGITFTSVFGFPLFSHYFSVISQKQAIETKIASNRKQTENMFVEYEKYVGGRENIYRSKLNNVVAGKEINPSEYRLYGFENNRAVSDSEQIKNKVFTLHSQLLPPEYAEMKQKSVIRSPLFFNWSLVDYIKEMEKNAENWSNELVQLSKYSQMNETAVNFSYKLSFDDLKSLFIKKKFKLDINLGNVLYFCLALFLTTFCLIPYILSRRHPKAPRPIYRCFSKSTAMYKDIFTIDKMELFRIPDDITKENLTEPKPEEDKPLDDMEMKEDDCLSNQIDIQHLTAAEIVQLIIKTNITWYELTGSEDFDADIQGNVTQQLKNYYIEKVEELKAKEIAYAVHDGYVTMEELMDTYRLEYAKRTEAENLLKTLKEDWEMFVNIMNLGDYQAYTKCFVNGRYIHIVKKKIAEYDVEEFKQADTIEAIDKYLENFPNGNYYQQALEKKRQLIEADRRDINKYTPDEYVKKFGKEARNKLCAAHKIPRKIVDGFETPKLIVSHYAPQNVTEIPSGVTEVYLWGIVSSGKSSAIAAIFKTMKVLYSFVNPKGNQYGGTYKDSLVEIFNNDYGYLPDGTNVDVTEYMRFRLKRRNSMNKYMEIVFVELAGEVFTYYYKFNNNPNDANLANTDEGQSFQKIRMFLQSDNPKIHFFFIDHTNDTKEQAKYLEAAKTYFENHRSILNKNTDSIHVVLTKADRIPIDPVLKAEIEKMKDKVKAKEMEANARVKTILPFLREKYGSFFNALKDICDEKHIPLSFRLFSIGDVFFKRICKMNRDYTKNIIEILFDRIRPENKSKFINYLNS